MDRTSHCRPRLDLPPPQALRKTFCLPLAWSLRSAVGTCCSFSSQYICSSRIAIQFLWRRIRRLFSMLSGFFLSIWSCRRLTDSGPARADPDRCPDAEDSWCAKPLSDTGMRRRWWVLNGFQPSLNRLSANVLSDSRANEKGCLQSQTALGIYSGARITSPPSPWLLSERPDRRCRPAWSSRPKR